jgi:predicted phage terminase large subunit-like protein
MFDGETRATIEQRSLEAFTKSIFRPFQSSSHIKTLIDALENAVETPNARLIVTLPPRHSKSLNVSEHLPAWYLGRFPDKRIIAASHTASLAYTFSRRVRNKMGGPKWPFPNVRVADDKGAVSAWDIAGHLGGYVSVGVGGSPVGSGGDLILIDDPIRSQADAESETVRDATWEWYQGTLRTRLEPGGSIILTATRWHEDDLTGRLLDEAQRGGEQWEHLHMPAISDDGHALWPERWPVDALLAIKSAVGARVFESQYQGRPVPAEGGTFKRAWWRTYDELPLLQRIEVELDSAFKTGIANDWSVFSAWGLDYANNAYLLHVWRQRVEFPDLIRMGYSVMDAVSAKFAPLNPILVVEDKASGQSAIQVWRDADSDSALSVVAYKPRDPTASKQSRAEGITSFVEGGRVFVPSHAEWLEDWLIEHDRFPSGKHDDQVDTTVMAINRLIASKTNSWNAKDNGRLGDFLAASGVGA